MHKPLSDRDWTPHFETIHPAFAQLPSDTNWTQFNRWPHCDHLNRLLPADVCNHQGRSVRFAAQDVSLPWPELYYEQRIAQHGIIATRNNWHDFFNAMVWCLFPCAKASISALHAADFDPTASNRTRQRDALTLFDENGALIVASDRELLQAIIDFNWQAVFVDHRDKWHKNAHCHIVGHALFEKLLTPYVGITANTRLVLVPEAYFELSAQRQRHFLDKRLAGALNNKDLQSPRNLSPFPLLGVTDWWDYQDHDFFANSNYFRTQSFERQATILTLST